ncbi:MAG: hypothetical protein ACREFO_21370 [Acetobacteraceae bacterium]
MGCALLTGFEPYAGRGANPAYEVMNALDGERIGGVPIVGRALPVSHGGLRDRIQDLLEDLSPIVALGLGLWPGEPVVRLERSAANLADFEIADNDGQVLADDPLVPDGALSLAATLPLREIERALLAEGIPVRLSGTAGSFLCNACLYHLLHAGASRPVAPLSGFLHLPYLPAQVAELMRETRREGRLELHQRADLASMDLSTATRAARVALAVSLQVAKAR